MNDKRIVDVECSDILYDYYDLFSRKTPDEVIEAMNEFKANHPNREELYFILQVNAHDHGVDVIVKERRLETDKEYQDRLKQEALANQYRSKKKMAVFLMGAHMCLIGAMKVSRII